MINNNETNLENKEQESKNKKGIIIFVIVFLTIFLIVTCFITFKYLLPKDNDINPDNNQQEDNANQYNYKYKLDIYTNEGSYYCKEQSDYCNTLAFTIKTETLDAKVLDIDNNSYILYKDNGLKLYDINKKEISKIDLEDTYNTYNLVLDENDKLMGVVYKGIDSEYSAYYNLTTNKKMYENKYTSINSTNTSDYLSAYGGENQSFLLNAKEEKEEFVSSKFDNLNCGTYYSVNKLNEKYIYFENEGCESYIIKNIYANNKKLLVKDIHSNYISVYDNYLYILDNNILKKYDVDGNVITTVNVNKDKVKQIINNYLIYIDNNNYLSIMNIDNTKENKQVIKWNENKYTYDDFSTYYTKEELKELDKDSEEGLYLLIYYKDGKDADGNYGIEYCYNTNKEIKEYPVDHEMGGRAKPVLYLYPTEETKVKVEFEHPEYLTTTYPKYQDKWEVIAKPNGDLRDKDNKYYYALYWDEVRYHEVDFKEGFYVTKDKAINFLEDKLKIIGLNSREANEFIMYFLPILENNEKSLVYFELTKEREQNNKLIITPKPDSLLRVTIHIKKVNKETTIKEEKLETFKRIGFSAVEWGGMLY